MITEYWRLNLVFCFVPFLFFCCCCLGFCFVLSKMIAVASILGLRNLLGEPRSNTQQIILSCGLFVPSQFWHLLFPSRLASGLKIEVSLSILGWPLWFLSSLLSTQSLSLLCLFTCPWAPPDHYSPRIWAWEDLFWVVVMVFWGCWELNFM